MDPFRWLATKEEQSMSNVEKRERAAEMTAKCNVDSEAIDGVRTFYATLIIPVPVTHTEGPMMIRFIRHHIEDGIYLVADHFDWGGVHYRLKYKAAYSEPFATELDAMAYLPEFRAMYLANP